jgi:isocitrate dehydrogenase
MFSDTITITINSVAKVLNRINQDGYSSEYLLKTSTDQFALRLRNSSYTDKTRGKVIDRHNVELVQTIYPVAPATVSTVRKYYSVLENEQGDAVTDALNFGLGIVGFQTSANLTKLLNWES